MTKLFHILFPCFLFASSFNAQYSTFKNGNKWGITKNSADFIPAIYDTIIPYDSSHSVCMACVKTQKPATNRFIKMNNMTILCKYLDENKEPLVIKIKNDTCSYFNFNKSAVANYNNHQNYIVVSAKDKKYVVDNKLKQVTFTGYDEIIPLSIKNHFLVETKTPAALYLEGVIDETEKLIIPMEYTHIKSNPFDTLFICCTAQIKTLGYDDVFDITGKKIHSFNRHVDNATKNFIIHKVFEPKEYYIIYDLHTKKEKPIYAEDITYLGEDVVNIKIKGKYYKSSLFKLDDLKIPNNE